MTESDKQGKFPRDQIWALNERNINGIRRYWFSCSFICKTMAKSSSKIKSENRGLEIMICKNHFVSRNELIITHHASKRTVYSKFKITIDFNYILSRKAVRIAKTAALKFGEFRISCFFFLFLVSVVRPVPRSARAARIFFFFWIPTTLRLDRSTSGSPNLPKVRVLISCATQASNHRNY